VLAYQLIRDHSPGEFDRWEMRDWQENG
jgi:hypothetical protein